MDASSREALLAASRGEFAAFCRALGVMPEMMRSRINEAAMEHIGDEILDGEFTLIEEYGEDVLSALSVVGEDMS